MSVERRIHQRSHAVSRHFRAMPHGRGRAGEYHATARHMAGSSPAALARNTALEVPSHHLVRQHQLQELGVAHGGGAGQGQALGQEVEGVAELDLMQRGL